MLGANYATVDELKSYLRTPAGSPGTLDDAMTTALASASREIEDYTNRQFGNDYDINNVQGAATTRVYKPTAIRMLLVDDFYTTQDLVIRHRVITGSLGDPWQPNTYYELEPMNGVVNGTPGWPYRRIVLPYWRYLWNISRVEVTAHWGWAAVPAPIKQACLMLAAQNFKLGSAPLGVAGTSDGSQGMPPVHAHSMPDVCALLGPYAGTHPLVG